MTVHAIQAIDIPRLQSLLDDAEVERNRLNRRIRRLRDALKAVESGEPIQEFSDLFEGARPPPELRPPEPPRAQLLAPSYPPAAAPAPVYPAAAAFPPVPGMALGFPTWLGEGLPPGVPSQAPLPPAAAAPVMPSVDVGALGRMTPEALDALPFGVVTLDGAGRIVGYNDTESRMAGLPRDAVVGRNFFTDVAPCSRVRDFEGRFRDFAAGRSRLALETFEFVFHFRAGAQRVVILISPARYRGQFHVSMIRR